LLVGASSIEIDGAGAGAGAGDGDGDGDGDGGGSGVVPGDAGTGGWDFFETILKDTAPHSSVALLLLVVEVLMDDDAEVFARS